MPFLRDLKDLPSESDAELIATSGRLLHPRDWHHVSVSGDYPDSPEIRYSDGSVHKGLSVSVAELPPLGLDGVDLTWIMINFQVRLQFEETEVVIETPFRLSAAGEPHDLRPDEPESLGPLLAIYPATLAAAVVEPDLTLRLDFAGGARIEIPPYPMYEAWQVSGPGRRLIVCPPEGGNTLAVWQ